MPTLSELPVRSARKCERVCVDSFLLAKVCEASWSPNRPASMIPGRTFRSCYRASNACHCCPSTSYQSRRKSDVESIIRAGAAIQESGRNEVASIWASQAILQSPQILRFEVGPTNHGHFFEVVPSFEHLQVAAVSGDQSPPVPIRSLSSVGRYTAAKVPRTSRSLLESDHPQQAFAVLPSNSKV